ncbi:hypothetical protein KC929_01970 [Patescibacteria group bacterium]|nr:hypothetical protein [Patescibacteria group bacterium]
MSPKKITHFSFVYKFKKDSDLDISSLYEKFEKVNSYLGKFRIEKIPVPDSAPDEIPRIIMKSNNLEIIFSKSSIQIAFNYNDTENLGNLRDNEVEIKRLSSLFVSQDLNIQTHLDWIGVVIKGIVLKEDPNKSLNIIKDEIYNEFDLSESKNDFRVLIHQEKNSEVIEAEGTIFQNLFNLNLEVGTHPRKKGSKDEQVGIFYSVDNNTRYLKGVPYNSDFLEKMIRDTSNYFDSGFLVENVD